MTRQELIATIQSKGVRYLECAEDWEAEIIEWQVICTIFECGLAQGFNPPDYDLQAILEADDDESDGVPEIGCEAALIDLIERITEPEKSKGIEEPELREMFLTMERAFGR
jgi:hypothetical protein